MVGITTIASAMLLAVPALSAPLSAKGSNTEPSSVHIMQLTRHTGISNTNTSPYRAKKLLKTGTGTFTANQGPAIGLVMSTEMKFNNQSVQMVVDTGSSDTWVVGSKFQCQDPTSKKIIPESECLFGSTYNYAQSKSFQKIPNQNFNISYLDGEYLTGIFGKENVTLAGISVNQQIAVVDKAAWFGDSFTSGLVGLAYPAITSAYNGTDPTKDSPKSTIRYNPIFTTMWQNKIVSSIFSIALTRSTKVNAGGILAIGGLPTTIPYDTKSLARAPLLKTCRVESGCHSGIPEFQHYTINVDNMQLGKADPKKTVTNITAPSLTSSGFEAVVDSGTSDIEVPMLIAKAINGAYSPPAVYNDSVGAFVTLCNATVPAINFQIGGKKFTIDKRDMLLPGIGGLDKTQCLTSVNGRDEAPFLLGDVFLRNVLAVFDVGNTEMRFYTTNV